KNLEVAGAKLIAKIDKVHAKAAIWLVAPESTDCLVIGEPVKRRFDVDVSRSLKNLGQHSFGQHENVVGLDKGRFDIDLGKFRLPLSAQVFVAKTFRDLKIFLHSCHHEELFVLLGRLRKRV